MPGTRLNRPVPKNKLPLPWFLKTYHEKAKKKPAGRRDCQGVVSWDWKVGSQVWMEWCEVDGMGGWGWGMDGGDF